MKLLYCLIILSIIFNNVNSEFVVKTEYHESGNCLDVSKKIEVYSSCSVLGKVQMAGNDHIGAYGNPSRVMNPTCEGYTELINDSIKVGICDNTTLSKSTVHAFPTYKDALRSLPDNTCNEILFMGGCEENYIITSFAQGACNPFLTDNGTIAYLKTVCSTDQFSTFACTNDKCDENCFPITSPYKKGTQCVPGLDPSGKPVDNIYRKFVAKFPGTTFDPQDTLQPELTQTPTATNVQKDVSSEFDPNSSSTLIYSFVLLISTLLLSLLL